MRHLALVALAFALPLATSSCKKDSSKGLPPATDWSATPGGAEGAGGSGPSAQANPHGPMTNPHGPGGPSPHGPGGPGGGGGGDVPMPEKTAPRTLEKLAGGQVALGPFSFSPPAGWTEKSITSSMRAAQYTLPGDAGAEAELVVYYFGEGGAGGVQANIDRWLDQFQQVNNRPSKDVAKTEKAKFAGQETTIVSVSGRYVTTSMPGGGDPIDKPDYALLAAIIESPKGPYYFKLVGPKKTVDAQAAKFRGLLTSMKLR
jgi:hypothetical protein